MNVWYFYDINIIIFYFMKEFVYLTRKNKKNQRQMKQRKKEKTEKYKENNRRLERNVKYVV